MKTVADVIQELSHLNPAAPILWMYVEKDTSSHTADNWSNAEWSAFVEEFDETFVDVSYGAARNMVNLFECETIIPARCAAATKSKSR